MNKTYIAADTYFFNRAAARAQHKSIEKYNQMIIDKINDTVLNDNDYIILNGEISSGSTEETIELLKQIKAKIILLAKENIYNDNIIFNCPLNIDITATINGVESHVIVLSGAEEKYNNYISIPNIYIAAAGTILKQKFKYQKPFLNLSLSNWDFIPIELGEELPQIIDNLELFNSMENDKEEII